ncbi:hypothetical protein MHH33_14095 [Paenisporosarcina sp. FSL H8-0542]|nr:hypothetical protein [Paenisporosarcina sp. HGH0030]
MLKSIEMMTAAYLEMAKDGKDDFTSDKYVDVLKEMYKKKHQEN